MELLSTFSQGNRTAKIYADFSGFTVEYIMNERVVKKTHHVAEDLAEDLAEDFISEGGSNPTLLNEQSS
jgi:hypothetical protein